jgi:hypothetical protein
MQMICYAVVLDRGEASPIPPAKLEWGANRADNYTEGFPGPDTVMDFPSRAKDFSGARK